MFSRESLRVKLQFTNHIFLRTAVLRKLFDIRFSYNHCHFSSVCLLVKMASKTVTRSIIYKQDTTQGTSIDIFICFSFTSCVINTDDKTNNKCKQGANRDRKADPLKFSLPSILSEGGTGVTQRQFSENICSEDDLRNLEISEHLL